MPGLTLVENAQQLDGDKGRHGHHGHDAEGVRHDVAAHGGAGAHGEGQEEGGRHGTGGHAVGGSIVTDAFGVVAMVAMTPLVTIQLLGVLYQRKIRHQHVAAVSVPAAVEDIIELD